MQIVGKLMQHFPPHPPKEGIVGGVRRMGPVQKYQIVHHLVK
jgi:hypothetical protein